MTMAMMRGDAAAETAHAAGCRPPTGAEYIESLRDDRAVYIDGERVTDVTTHPAMRNAVCSIARMYDALHDPAQREELVCATDTGSAGFTHRFFRVARSSADLVASQRAITAWARMSYGWMGRSPDYKAAFTAALGAAPGFFGAYEGTARRWYARAQETLPFICHAIVNPPIDRHKDVSAVKDVYVRAERETDAGLIVSGAKVVATSAAMTNWTFIGQTPKTAGDDAELALAFMVPTAAPGVKVICRASYEQSAARHGSPFDYPLSSRFDENDAIVVLDRVCVPWEHVLMYRDPSRVRGFFHATGFVNNYLFHGCTRLGVKLDFLSGLLARCLRATGGDEFRTNQALLGELVAWRHTIWSLSNAMACNPDAFVQGAVLPARQAAMAYSVLGAECYSKARDIIQKALGSALIYLPSSARDLESAELEPLLQRYVRGSHGIDHVERIKLMKLMWDAVSSEFGGRHELYERCYTGGWEDNRIQAMMEAERSGRMRSMTDLVDECMSEYDASGWIGGAWSTPADGARRA